ncbi:MAG: SIMPL domain-containing protein [Cetobacterium sp.]|nr:SIMPL domain-containing protein [Cetobacterium sp.]
MKKLLLGLFICGSLVSYSQDIEQKISLRGSGKIQLVPNKAEIQFTVLTENKNLDKATKENTKVMNKVKENLEDLGIKNSNVKTINYNVEKIKEGEKKDQDVYYVRNSFNIELENLKSLGKVISTLEKAGVNEVGGIEFTSTEINEKSKEAMVLAYKDAYNKAQAVAQAAGYKTIMPVDISYDYMPVRGLGMVSFAESNSSNNIYVPNKLDVEVGVRTVFVVNEQK